MKKAIAEIKRVLVPGGFFQVTFLSKNNFYFGKGEKIDSNTYLCDDGTDKSHPHCYLDENEVHEAMTDFEIINFDETDHSNYEDAFHYHVVAILK